MFDEISLHPRWSLLSVRDWIKVKTNTGEVFNAEVIDKDNEFVTIQQTNGHILELSYYDLETRFFIIGSVLI